MYICRVGLYLNCSVLCDKPSQIFDDVIFTLVLYRASLDFYLMLQTLVKVL